MESSIRTWSLARSSLRTVKTLGRSGSVNSVSGDSGIDSEYTHVSVGSSGFYPSLYVKIKYPTEADDAARSGMLTSCDFDEILEKLQDVFQTWEIYLDAKRMNHYTRHALPRTLTSESPRHRIIVKVKFTAWRSNIDTHSIRRIVEEVLNKDGEFLCKVMLEPLPTRSVLYETVCDDVVRLQLSMPHLYNTEKHMEGIDYMAVPGGV